MSYDLVLWVPGGVGDSHIKLRGGLFCGRGLNFFSPERDQF